MISQSLLPEFDHEMGTLRKYLDRFPDGQPDYKPHDKSMSAAELATHLAEMVGWVPATCMRDEIDISGYQPSIAKTRADLLARFDKSVVAAREALEKTEDSDWMRPWALKAGEHVLFSMPKVGVYRSMVMNHIIHHRGQLSVYYRACGVAVPSTYGPSADEK